MKCTSKIKIDQSAIKQLSQAAVISLEHTGEELMDEMRNEQVIPMKTGTLRGEGFFEDISQSDKGVVSLVHTVPYARRLYFHPEYNFNKEFAANAKGKWFEDWIPGGKYADSAQKIFKEMYRRNAGV